MERLESFLDQGTLFGASSQAGVVRMITNKPVVGEDQVMLKLSIDCLQKVILK